MISVLDHGYVRLIETWGHGDADVPEAGIVEAARQSTQGSFRGWDEDGKLIRHLFNSRPQHAGPFEFAGAVLEIQAPIFVFREWHRHRTQSYAEMSARYSPPPDLYYLPSVERLMTKASDSNKQAGKLKGSGTLTSEEAEAFQTLLREQYESCEELYRQGMAAGVPKELARTIMPVGHYSRMRSSSNLRNWLAFLTLRADPAAQWEIRQYAEAVADILSKEFPKTWELFSGGKNEQ